MVAMNVEQKARELHEIHDRWLAEETDEGFIEYLARAPGGVSDV